MIDCVNKLCYSERIMYLSVDRLFTLNTEGDTNILFPRGIDELVAVDQTLTHDALVRPFWVEGTRSEDVIVFSDGAMDETGVSGPQAYLCIEAHNQSMVLATEEFLLDNPGYQTMHLQKSCVASMRVNLRNLDSRRYIAP